MKRITVFLLAFMLMLSCTWLTACKGEKPTESVVPENEISEPTAEISKPIPDRTLPYTLKITRVDTPIYSDAGYGYDIVATTDISGEYTVTEETLDEHGTVWGKLESGRGWIDVKAVEEREAGGPAVMARLVSDKVLESGSYYSFVAEESDYLERLIFDAARPVTNVKLSLLRQNDEGGYTEDKALYYLNELNETKPLVAGVVFYGDFTAYGISYNEGQKEYSYYLIISGKDGSLIMGEYQ